MGGNSPDKPDTDMNDRSNPPHELLRTTTQADVFAGSLRASLGLLGPAGVVVGEFLTYFVPNQRLDRLTEYTSLLRDRVEDLQAFQARLEASAAFAAVFEQATIAAVQTPSHDRRKDLAAFVQTGFGTDDAELMHHHALLRLLEQINEAQVLVLMSYANFSGSMGDKAHQAFLAQHPGIFSVEPPGFGDSYEVQERWAMKQFYEDQLVRLGLLKDEEGTVRSAVRRVSVTTLGQMLLAAIGRLDESWMRR